MLVSPLYPWKQLQQAVPGGWERAGAGNGLGSQIACSRLGEELHSASLHNCGSSELFTFTWQRAGHHCWDPYHERLQK